MANRRDLLKIAMAGCLTGGFVSAWAVDRSRRVAEAIARFDGDIVLPSDTAYDALRRTASSNSRFDRLPVAIARCATTDDVLRVIDVAASFDLDLAARAGGHDVLGASTGNGIVIDLSRMDGVEWVDDSLAVGAGVRAGRVDAVTAMRDRLIPLGCNPAVGVSGLTLGGGLGWFLGTHGAACDAVEAATMVTLDGRVRAVSPESNPDLDWAIRGGGGNFGIVTSWRYRTFPLADLTVGLAVFRGADLHRFLEWYRETMADAPDELTIEVVGNAHVEPIVAAIIVHTGDEASAMRIADSLERAAPPLVSLFRRSRLIDMPATDPAVGRFFQWRETPLDEARAPGSYWQGITVESMEDGVIDAIVDAFGDSPRGFSFGLGHTMHGALTRSGTSAFPRRAGRTTIHFAGGWSYASREAGLMNWVDASVAALDRFRSGEEYINYLSRDSVTDVRSAYGEHFPRLRAIKRRYDPDNLLRGNRNIDPNA